MIRNRSYGGKKVWAKGGATKHATFRGSCPPGGRDHEDTTGGAIPINRKRMQRWILDRWLRISRWTGLMVKLAHDFDGSLDYTRNRMCHDKYRARCVCNVV